MHVNAKKIAVSGMMLALTVVCLLLGGILESNTLFLLAAASYFVGIIYREYKARLAAAFYLAGVLLGFLLAPNKLYVLTYAAMGLYILLSEGVWEWMGKKVTVETQRTYMCLIWLVKYLLFNLFYIPAVLLMQDLLFGKKLSITLTVIALAAGQVGLFLYDCAYRYVQSSIWNKLRGKLLD